MTRNARTLYDSPADRRHTKASDYISAFLESQGVRFVLELSGGMIIHMLDFMHQSGINRAAESPAYRQSSVLSEK